MKSNSYLIRRLGRDLKAGRCSIDGVRMICLDSWWIVRDGESTHYVHCTLRPTWEKYLREGRA